MKTLVSLTVFLLGFVTVRAESFPGLRGLMSEAEWQRAGLSQLTPDQVGVIDAALIRYQAGATAQHQAELTEARAVAPSAPANVGTYTPPVPKTWWAKFGLPTWDGPDWRSQPPLKAKVAAWEGGNRFRLDNGQVWEGYEAITYDLPGHDIEIEARPNNGFALTVDGKKTTLRVMRLR